MEVLFEGRTTRGACRSWNEQLPASWASGGPSAAHHADHLGDTGRAEEHPTQTRLTHHTLSALCQSMKMNAAD